MTGDRTHYDITVQHVSHCATVTLLILIRSPSRLTSAIVTGSDRIGRRKYDRLPLDKYQCAGIKRDLQHSKYKLATLVESDPKAHFQ